jgi:hypothetical protein
LVGQLAQSAQLTTPAAVNVAVTGEDDTTGTVNKALVLLTRNIPTELVAPYGAITAALPAISPSADVVKAYGSKSPPVLAGDIPVCKYDFDGRLWWFIGFAVLALFAVPLLNATRDVAADWRMVGFIDAPIALLAFLLWGLALPASPLESVCGRSVAAIQVACAVLGAFLVPTLAAALKNTVGPRWRPKPPAPAPPPNGN